MDLVGVGDDTGGETTAAGTSEAGGGTGGGLLSVAWDWVQLTSNLRNEKESCTCTCIQILVNVHSP